MKRNITKSNNLKPRIIIFSIHSYTFYIANLIFSIDSSTLHNSSLIRSADTKIYINKFSPVAYKFHIYTHENVLIELESRQPKNIEQEYKKKYKQNLRMRQPLATKPTR